MKMFIKEVEGLVAMFRDHQYIKQAAAKRSNPDKEIESMKSRVMKAFAIPPQESKVYNDPYSESWHKVFQNNTQKIGDIFQSMGLSKEQIDEIIKEYAQRVHQNQWKRS